MIEKVLRDTKREREREEERVRERGGKRKKGWISWNKINWTCGEERKKFRNHIKESTGIAEVCVCVCVCVCERERERERKVVRSEWIWPVNAIKVVSDFSGKWWPVRRTGSRWLSSQADCKATETKTIV